MSESRQHRLAQALQHVPVATAAAEHLAACAADCFKNHIAPIGISKAQMAALGSYLRRADSLREAICNCGDFLIRQMDKLEKREANGAKPAGWRQLSTCGNRQCPVGDIIVDWFVYNCYLPNNALPSLPLLQRFWHQIEILYHFSAVTHKTPPLHKEICP